MHKYFEKNYLLKTIFFLRMVLKKHLLCAKIQTEVFDMKKEENNSPKKEKSKKSKIIKAISAIAGAGVAVTAGIIALNGAGIIGGGKGPASTHETLSQVTNLVYDEKTCILSWNEVEHADMYRVDVNGKRSNVETNSYSFMPTKKDSTIKVQAMDSTGVYALSKWSDAFTYTIPDNTISTQSVFAFVNKLDSSSELVNIAGMYIEDGKLFSKCHIIDYNDKDKVVVYRTLFDTQVNTLEDAMKTKAISTSIVEKYDYSSYKSAEYFLKSSSYVGQMEEYRKQGYKFEIVSSEVADQGIDCLAMYGTYRLTKDDEIKYIESTMDFGIYNPSSIKEINYTSKLEKISERNACELSFHELTDGFYDWANLTYESNQAKKADGKKSLKTQKMYAITNKKEKQDEDLEMSF